jgi:hypothetical protein
MLPSFRAACFAAAATQCGSAAMRLLHGDATAALYPATVEKVRDVEGTDIRLLRVRAHEIVSSDNALDRRACHHPQPFSYAAGQWVDFHIHGVAAVGGYSMISSPTPLPPLLARVLDSPSLPVFDLAVKKASNSLHRFMLTNPPILSPSPLLPLSPSPPLPLPPSPPCT